MEKMILDHYFDQSILDKIKIMEDKITQLDRHMNDKVNKIVAIIDENSKKQIMDNNMILEHMKTSIDAMNQRQNCDISNIFVKYNSMLVDTVNRQLDNHNKMLKEIVFELDKNRTNDYNVLMGNMDHINDKIDSHNNILKEIVELDKKRTDEYNILIENVNKFDEKINNLSNKNTNIDYSRLLNNAIRNNIPLGFNTTRAIYELNKLSKKDVDLKESQ